MSERDKEDLKKCFLNDNRSKLKIETLYTNSNQKVKSTRKWDEKTVTDAMTKNYTARWVGNWFWPHNLVLYWSTSYDRSNIMARTLSDNLFDVGYDWDNFFTPWKYGDDLKFKDFNAERPYLIINATDSTASESNNAEHKSIHNENSNQEEPEPSTFGRIFTFTTETFYEQLNSDINEYPVGHAVMASAAFPAVFNYVTMRNYTTEGAKKNYVHVFDGGNTDNLGITSVRNILERYGEQNKKKLEKVVVILVDAYTKPIGIDRRKSDSRTSFFLERFVDLNLMDSFDTLLSANRSHKVAEFRKWFNKKFPEDSVFLHITFEGLPSKENDLRENLDKIPTDFSINDENARYIDRAVEILLSEDNLILQRIKSLLVDH